MHAQKLEAVGTLAIFQFSTINGGVAHDFNNMLCPVFAYTEIAMSKIAPDDPVQEYLKETSGGVAHDAGLCSAMSKIAPDDRAADITRQLLAFARRQTITPQVLDLNETVEGMLSMLRRLIGEDIELSWQPGGSIAPVRMDPSQLNQILANLCVNARDAIGGVGKLTIHTDSVRLDENFCPDRPGFTPGEFVMLAVSDDGCGMDKETLAKVFDPFFTTKKAGEGTGLGLATVYGIVRQNDAYINVYSEPHNGTTIRIYLPQHQGESPASVAHDVGRVPQSHGETVLVVEDEATVLRLVETILDRLHYTVLTASTPGHAVALAKEHADEIHLLITDVVMPEMNGRDLADQLHGICPDLKVLFMSGYPANIIAQRGVLDQGLDFLQKPFSERGLALKVRQVLDQDKPVVDVA